MNKLQKDTIVTKVRDILKQYGDFIKFAYLFGSYAKEQTDEYSDIDLGIYFDRSLPDQLRNEIRFKIYDALEPYDVDICYLDMEDISPEIFLSVVDGMPILINDEESLYEARIKNIHLSEELKSLER